MKNTHGPTQDRIVDWLRQNGQQYQLTTEELATILGIDKNKVKHAVARLFASGVVLRSQGRPAKWSIAPQVVQTPPQGHTASLHGTMPRA